jgi:hypothetical protein
MVITFERLDQQWNPMFYYLGKAISDAGKEFSQCLVSNEQFPQFIKAAEAYFNKEQNVPSHI